MSKRKRIDYSSESDDGDEPNDSIEEVYSDDSIEELFSKRRSSISLRDKRNPNKRSTFSSGSGSTSKDNTTLFYGQDSADKSTPRRAKKTSKPHRLSSQSSIKARCRQDKENE